LSSSWRWHFSARASGHSAGHGVRCRAERNRRPERRPVQHVRQYLIHHHAVIIGFILQATGSFNGALVFIGGNAAVAILSYVVVLGEIKRLELKPA
jgi:hypothetical protein